jgi:uncharacterized protein YdiU (UPF0061 family)
VTDPYLVNYSSSVGKLIDLPKKGGKDFLVNFSSNQPMNGTQPLAMSYYGHQFGSYNARRGDGRALLLEEDFSELTRLRVLLKKPFEDRPELLKKYNIKADFYSQDTPQEFLGRQSSCSKYHLT